MSSESYNVITNFIYNVQGDLKIGAMDKKLGAMGKTTSGTQRALENMAGYLARDFVNALSRGAQEAVNMGVKIGSLEASFEALVAAQDGTTISIDDLRKATKGTVADIDLFTQANNGLLLGVPTDAIIEMMEASVALGAAVGKDTLFAVESLTTGVGRQSRLMLDNVGIIVKADQAYRAFADTIGKKVDALTEDERKTAFVNAAIDAMRQRTSMLGSAVDETTLQVQRLNAGLDNVKTAAGSAAVEGFGPLASMLTGTLIPALAVVAGPALGTAIGSLVGAGGLTAALMSVTAVVPPLAAALAVAAVAYAALSYEADESTESIMSAAQRMSQGIMTEAEAIIDFGSIVEAEMAGFTVVTEESLRSAGDAIGSLEAPLEEAGDAVEEFAERSTRALEGEAIDAWRIHEQALADYAEFIATQKQLYSDSIGDLVAYYEDYYGTNLGGYERAFEVAERYFDDLEFEESQSHDIRLGEINDFYDDMLSAEKSFLDDLRANRRIDLDDLELTFLLQKQALQASFDERRISKKTFEEQITALERSYRNQRSQISDDYRIEELQAEKEFSKDSQTIEEQRLVALETENRDWAITLHNLTAQEKADFRAMYADFLKTAEFYGQELGFEFSDLATAFGLSTDSMSLSMDDLIEIARGGYDDIRQIASDMKLTYDELDAILDAANDTTTNPPPSDEAPIAPPPPSGGGSTYSGIKIRRVGGTDAKPIYGSDYTASLRFSIEDVIKDLKALGYARGFEGWVTGPTPMLVGEAGPEYVSITPQSKMGAGGAKGGGDVNVFLSLPGVRQIPEDVGKIRMLSRELGQYIIDQLASEGVI